MIESSSKYPVYSPCRAVVIGLGGGGGNTVAHLAKHCIDGPEIISVNTDVQALASCQGLRTVQIGVNTTQGLGTGGDPLVGKIASEESRPILHDLILGANLVVLVLGLGGGTGTGVAPILAEMAHEEGIFVLSFATLPFEFEGSQRTRQAEEGLQLLSAHSDLVIRLPNEHLLVRSDESESLINAFNKSDEMLSIAIHSIWSLLAKRGVMNLDFANLKSLAECNNGISTFGYSEGSGEQKAEIALQSLFHGPLFSEDDVMDTCDQLIINITGGNDLKLIEIQSIMDELRKKLPGDVSILMGTALREEMDNKIIITLLMSQKDGMYKVPPLEIPLSLPSTFENKNAKNPSIKDRTRHKKILRVKQVDLNFDAESKGRFKGVEPTLYNGADLDIPTFIRRGVKLSFEK